MSTDYPPLLTAAEEVELARRRDDGDAQAVNELASANMALVPHLSRWYIERYPCSRDDILQEGFIGLLAAARKFDPAKGCRFSTYACLWVRQAIRRWQQCQVPTIAVPVRLQRTKVSDDDQRFLAAARRAVRPCVSLPGDGFGQLVANPCGTDFDAGETSKRLRALLLGLDDRSRHVIDRYYGLGGGDPETLAEIGKSFGLTRERIRQIQRAALARLRRAVSA